MYAILCALGKDTSEISLQVDKQRIKIHKLLKKQEDKEHAQGLSKGWIAFSDLDFRHMFNHVVQQFGDNHSTSYSFCYYYSLEK